jgi:hypothetical protein
MAFSGPQGRQISPEAPSVANSLIPHPKKVEKTLIFC